MESQGEGPSTTKRVVAGAALAAAVPAAVGVAKKLLSSNEGNREEADRKSGASRSRQPSAAEGAGRGTTSSASAGSGKKTERSTGARTSRQRGSTSSSTRASSSSTRSSSSSTRSGGSKAKRGGAASSSRAAADKTKEQLYREATTLKISGRSKMDKAQLKRAVSRARNSSSS